MGTLQCRGPQVHLYRPVTINLHGESITAWDWNMFHTTCQTSMGKVIWNICHADIPTAPSQVFASSHCWISLSKEHTSPEKKYFYMVWWKTICFYIFPVQQESYTILHISISVLTMLRENCKKCSSTGSNTVQLLLHGWLNFNGDCGLTPQNPYGREASTVVHFFRYSLQCRLQCEFVIWTFINSYIHKHFLVPVVREQTLLSSLSFCGINVSTKLPIFMKFPGI